MHVHAYLQNYSVNSQILPQIIYLDIHIIERSVNIKIKKIYTYIYIYRYKLR